MNAPLTLTSKTPLGGNIWLFTFSPDTPFTWAAGQFIRVELSHPHPDAEGTKRSFTIASAPADHRLEIATRLTSSTFKQALNALALGGRISLLDLPAGDFTWPVAPAQVHRPLVFAAQGIGITPVRSLIRQRHHDGLPTRAHLIYTNLTLPIPFQSELEAWTARDPTLQITHLTAPITPTVIAQLVPNLSQTLVHVSGPSSLIGLLSPPVNLPAAHLKQDQFPNYAAINY